MKDIDIKFSLIQKHLNASIDIGRFDSSYFQSMIMYGFWADIRYKGDSWFYTYDHKDFKLQKKEIEYIIVRPKICSSSSAKINVTKKEFRFLQKLTKQYKFNKNITIYNG